jgi:hypothetical protein
MPSTAFCKCAGCFGFLAVLACVGRGRFAKSGAKCAAALGGDRSGACANREAWRAALRVATECGKAGY